MHERALRWAESLWELSPFANRLTKRTLHQAAQLNFSEAIAFEAMIQAQALNVLIAPKVLKRFYKTGAALFRRLNTQ